MRVSAFWRLAAAGVAAAALSGCGRQDQQAEAPPPPPAVSVMAVAQEDIKPTVTFTGRVQARDKVELRARVEGFLQKRLFEEGQDVKEGDLLFVIEQDSYKASVDEIKASIQKAEAALTLASIEVDRASQLVATPDGDPAAARRGQRQTGRCARRARASAGGARKSRAAAELYRNPRTDRRADRARNRVGRQLRWTIDRPARDDRAAGSDLRQLPGDPTRDARSPQGREGGGGAHDLSPPGRRHALRASREGQLCRRDGESRNRHRAGARAIPQPGPYSGRRAAGHGAGRGRLCADRAADTAARDPDRSVAAPLCWSSTAQTRSRCGGSRSIKDRAPS